MNIKYYYSEVKSFAHTNFIVLLGLGLGLMGVFIGRTKFLKALSLRIAKTNKFVREERVLHDRSVYAATQAVAEAEVSGQLSKARLKQARNMQYRVAKLKLREAPNMLMEDLVKELNKE